MNNLFSKIKQYLSNFVYGSKHKNPNAGRILGKYLRNIFKNCPVCEQNFNKHEISPFASVIFAKGNQHQIDKFLNLLQQNCWKTLMQIQEFNVKEDALIANVIRCPDKSIYWVVLFEPYSIDEGIELYDWNKVEFQSAREVGTLINAQDWSLTV